SAVAHQASDRGKFSNRVESGEAVTQGKRGDEAKRPDTSADQKGASPMLHHGRKRFLDAAFAVDIQHKQLAPDCASGLLHVRSLAVAVGGASRMDEVGDGCGLRYHVHEKPEPLGVQFAYQRGHASQIAAGAIETADESGLDWITAGTEYDWNCGRCRFGCKGGCSIDGTDNQIHAT